MALQSYRELIAWQKAVELVVTIYDVTKTFPKEEIYGLTAQMRRCAVSVPSNIAEGQGRLSTGEFKQFLGNARGSLFELQTQITIAERLKFVTAERAQQLLDSAIEVGKISNGLLASLH